MFTREWVAAAFQRALRTFAQAAVALIGTTAVIEGVDWLVVASGAGLAAILSILTSLGGLPETEGPIVMLVENDLEAEVDAQAADNDFDAFPYVD